ncbi:MAG: polyprenyl synthetase family protein [Tannerella sp.]|jgi:geranylgeranyl diphosphate synthase type II|nr:polyprenyl synthetase family protein [Tannerella sp.]
MLSFEQVLNRLEPEFNKIYFDRPPRSLFEPIEYTLALGGKRIRPCLTLMACNIYSNNVEEAVKPAMGLEVFHNFTLLHDDLMDQADMRRNRPTVHKKWNTNTAILSGDAMLIAAYRLIGETAEPYLKKVLDLFSETALEICCGQQYDMDFEKRDEVSEDEYLEMIRLKTAVLIACCMKTGAIIGGASEKDAEHLYRFGIYTGLAFQLQDDLLDVYGDTKTFGKNIGGDILCDKKTFLLINAMKSANEKQKARMAYFKDQSNGFTPEEKICAYTDIYNRLNIKEITQQKMNSLYKLAINELACLSADRESLTEINKISNMLMQRES